MLDHTSKAHGYSLFKVKGTLLLQLLVASCVLHGVSAAEPSPPTLEDVLFRLQELETRVKTSEESHAAELIAVRTDCYEQLQDIRKCTGCMSPSPPPPSPSPPPPSPPPPSPSPPPSPKPLCATPIDFALVLDESGSMNNDMEGPNGLKAFAKELVCHAAMEPRLGTPPLITLSLILSPCEPEPEPEPEPASPSLHGARAWSLSLEPEPEPSL